MKSIFLFVRFDIQLLADCRFETDVLASAGDDGSIKLWKNESPHIFVLGSPLLQYNWIRKIAWNHKKNILAFDDNKDNAVVLKQSK